MFFKKPGKPSKIKNAVYLLASTFLGLLLSLIFHAILEISYLKIAQSQGRIVFFYGHCALSPWLQAALWVFGGVGGFFLGRFWWRWIYVDRKWEKNKK